MWLQEVGEYGEKGMTKRAAVAIGPEFGMVGTELTREAAKEAVTFADVLVVCGFAFNPLAGEETTELGRLTVLRTRLSPDLLVGDLKKTGRPVPVLDNGSHEDRVRSGGEVTLAEDLARSPRSVGVEQLEHGGHRVQRRKRWRPDDQLKVGESGAAESPEPVGDLRGRALDGGAEHRR